MVEEISLHTHVPTNKHTIVVFMSGKNGTQILISVALNLHTASDRLNIFTILILPGHRHARSFLLGSSFFSVCFVEGSVLIRHGFNVTLV